jgi:hypothetical protein
MSEFSDRPFVAGSVTGLRAFRVDMLGRLTGVTHQDVWRPGENVATCYAKPKPTGNWAAGGVIHNPNIINVSGSPYTIGGNYYVSSAAPSPDKPVRGKQDNKPTKNHAIAGVDCTCGFYAYFDGGNDYLVQMGGGYTQPYSMGGWITVGGSDDDAPRIGAIVEGWGVCTVGTRGFRAEKAKVVGLIIPDSTKGRLEVAFTKARRNYPDALVFDTERDAVRAIPLTDPIQASPEDDDFWTRSAS